MAHRRQVTIHYTVAPFGYTDRSDIRPTTARSGTPPNPPRSDGRSGALRGTLCVPGHPMALIHMALIHMALIHMALIHGGVR